MKRYNYSHQSSFTQVILWLIPSVIETVAYMLVALLTLAISNIGFMNRFLFLPADFSLKQAVLGSIESVLKLIVGETAAETMLTAMFWALIGILVYVVLWLFINFSTEISNDLVARHYVNPQGNEKYAPLKGFVFRIIFQVFIAILLLFYINLLGNELVPLWTAKYAALVDYWPAAYAIRGALWTILLQIVSLHILTVLLRLFLLRKRLFG